jgi:hypothetical protein
LEAFVALFCEGTSLWLRFVPVGVAPEASEV